MTALLAHDHANTEFLNEGDRGHDDDGGDSCFFCAMRLHIVPPLTWIHATCLAPDITNLMGCSDYNS